MGNRCKLLADHSDSGPLDVTNAGNSDDEKRVNVVTGQEYGAQRATFKKGEEAGRHLLLKLPRQAERFPWAPSLMSTTS